MSDTRWVNRMQFFISGTYNEAPPVPNARFYKRAYGGVSDVNGSGYDYDVGFWVVEIASLSELLDFTDYENGLSIRRVCKERIQPMDEALYLPPHAIVLELGLRQEE